jgi:predicted short-subunit dehydrogenase-like oxidoreductase (DUF2520 family)
LGGHARHVDEADRVLYHAAAVVASNYLNSLVAVAVRILGEVGWSREDSLAALMPLLRGAVQNLADFGLPAALIGPIRRGDPRTVQRHLSALSRVDGDRGARTEALYRLLGIEALELAVETGLTDEVANELKELLA